MEQRDLKRAAQPEVLADDDLRARSLELLDFPAIREELASRTRLISARRLALELAPSYSAHEVERLQRETAEGLAFLEKTGDVNLHMGEDPSPAVARAALGGTVSGMELQLVAAWVDVQRRARIALEGARDVAPRLAVLAQDIPDLEFIHQRIGAAIGTRGEVVDGATPTLGALRHQVREGYERVTEALERTIRSDAGQASLQDQVISVRGERLVLQVKAELRHHIPGIVLGASNTGVTLFVEPFATVELCNTWKELALEEEREVARVLRELSALVGDAADDIQRGAEITAQLDFILAKARYSASLNGVAATTPVSSDGRQPRESGARVRLLGARHPLLGREAIPINVHIGPEWSVLVITGPNTGGKTVAMKTVGLLAAMNQSGLQIPAEQGSSLPVFDGIYADVGDQQSIRQSVSTFGSHMRRVIDILHHATPSSLTLLDELGTSTDPEEGSALAKAILTYLSSTGMITVATTHHRAVATHVEATPGMMNASVDLDPTTLEPSYHLTVGVPGRSYAMSVAARLGLPAEIMEQARSLLEPQHILFEDWLNELQNERGQLRERLQQADEARAGAEAEREKVEAQRTDLESRRDEIVHAMRAELVGDYEDLRKKLRRAESALSWSPSPGTVHVQDIEEAGAELDEARAGLDTLDKRASATSSQVERKPLAVGDPVEVRGLGVRGTVASIGGPGEDVEIAVGGVRLRVDASRLAPSGTDEEEHEPDGPGVGYGLGPVLGTTELDLRGHRADEALIKVEEFLDRALRDGLDSVRIIHGKGTGALRRAVRELLEHHPLAKSFAPEARDKGGDGATVVELT